MNEGSQSMIEMGYQKLLKISDDWLKYAIRLNLEHEPKAELVEIRNAGLADQRIKKSSAQITELYKCKDLIGKQVLAVVNFPPRQIADFMSEVLVLGTYSNTGVVLIIPDKDVQNGDKLG